MAALPCGLLVVCALSFSAALLAISRPGHSHAGGSAALGLVLPMLVLHGVGRILILIALRPTDDRTGGRTLCGSRQAVAVGPEVDD